MEKFYGDLIPSKSICLEKCISSYGHSPTLGSPSCTVNAKGNKHVRFFALPRELRELIYREALLYASQGPEILRTCHGIHAEAEKFLYQRPIIFRSQGALHGWVEARPRNMLQDVQDISLELQDVDLMPILISDPADDLSGRTRSIRTWELYEDELDKLSQAFEKLPNIRTISIRATSGRLTQLYEDFMAKVLRMVAAHWPSLQGLSLDGNMHGQSIEFMNDLKSLTAFTFDGFCATQPAETAAILSRLSLTRMAIASQPGLLMPTHRQHSTFTAKPQSLDGSVLRSMNQLACLSISERIPSATSPALFFTSEILSALHNHRTLSILSICLSHAPDEDTIDALGAFLGKNTSVTSLELDWPHLSPAVLYILTNRLSNLWIRAANASFAAVILGALLESREDRGVQSLRRVVLVRNSWDVEYEVGDLRDEDDEDENEDENDVDADTETDNEEEDVDLKHEDVSCTYPTMTTER